MKVIVATTNKVKLLGVNEALSKYFNDIEIIGVKAESNVPEQPFNEEILTGAKNRVNYLIKFCQKEQIKGDYFIGIESGITNQLGSWVNISIALIRDKEEFQSVGYSAAYPIPLKYIEEIKTKSLKVVMEETFKESELTSDKGGINFLTSGEITRVDLTKQAVTMALTTFINGDSWKDK